jgi:multiple sugar transport system substrate-binding protein
MHRQANAGRGRRWIRTRGVAAAAAAAGLVLAACGCSGSAAPSGKQSFQGQTLTVSDGAPTGAEATQTKEYYNYLSAQFHKETGATINWQYYTSGAQETTTIESSVVSGSGPDMIGYGSSYIGIIGAIDGFRTLTSADWNELGGRSSFVAAQLEDSGYTPSTDIGIPYESIPFVIAYNKTMFAKAGISSPPATWTEYINDAKKVMAANPGVYGAGFDPADPTDPWKFVWSYSLQLGGRFIAANGKSASMDSPQVKQALAFYFAQEYKYHIVPAQALTWDDAQMVTAFTEGKIAMIPLADYGTQVAAEGTAVAGKVGFAALPSVPYGMSARPAGGRPAETIVSGNYWAIPKYVGSKMQLALDFAKISVSPAAQLKQFHLLGWMPVTTAGVSEVESADGPAVKPFIAAERGSTSTAITPAWSYVEDGMEAVMSHVASQLATTHSYSASYASSQLAAEQSDVTSHLSSE